MTDLNLTQNGVFSYSLEKQKNRFLEVFSEKVWSLGDMCEEDGVFW